MNNSAEQQGIGLVHTALAKSGLRRQSSLYARHGIHDPASGAPLVLVACSGGRDSLALAFLARTVAGELGLRCGAVIVDHRLQPGSGTVARAAAGHCRALGLAPVVVTTITVRQEGQGQEAAARTARYAALTRQARLLHASAVLLAHTQDDQAETLLLALLKGSSPTALAGMPSHFTKDGILFLRPLLGLTRSQTTAICKAERLSWWDDPTNGDGIDPNDTRFATLPLRSRIRHTLLPLLRSLGGPAVTEHLAAIAVSQQKDQQALSQIATTALNRVLRPQSAVFPSTSPKICLDTAALQALPDAIRTRVLADALAILLHVQQAARGDAFRQAGLNRAVIEGLDRFVRGRIPSAHFEISSELSAYREASVTVLCQNVSHADRRRSGRHRKSPHHSHTD